MKKYIVLFVVNKEKAFFYYLQSVGVIIKRHLKKKNQLRC